MNANGKRKNTSRINNEWNKQTANSVENQPIRYKIHITKHKGDILRVMLDCFKEGGINGIKEGSLAELAEIIDDTFSFDFQGSTGVKATKKESILRTLKLCEQKRKEENH